MSASEHAVSYLPKGRLNVERVRRNQADVGRRASARSRWVHEGHLESSALLSVQETFAWIEVSNQIGYGMPLHSYRFAGS